MIYIVLEAFSVVNRIVAAHDMGRFGSQQQESRAIRVVEEYSEFGINPASPDPSSSVSVDSMLMTESSFIRALDVQIA
jgi:hypothetical protein